MLTGFFAAANVSARIRAFAANVNLYPHPALSLRLHQRRRCAKLLDR